MTITVANISLEMLKNLSNIGDEGEGIKKLGGRGLDLSLKNLKTKKLFIRECICLPIYLKISKKYLDL